MRIDPSYREDFIIGINAEEVKCLGDISTGNPWKTREGSQVGNSLWLSRMLLQPERPAHKYWSWPLVHHLFPGRTILQESLPLIITHVDECIFQEELKWTSLPAGLSFKKNGFGKQ